MMWHGMPYRSLAHIWYLHNDRYHGSKRNPWCEVEWGVHYSRSMASYGHFVAACGFEYHGPKGHIGFAPKVSPGVFKAPFVGAEGWGTFTQRDENGGRIASLRVAHGSLRLKTIALDVERAPTTVELQVVGRVIPARHVTEGKRVLISLPEAVTLTESQTIDVNIQ
jgi:hypothetical protein